MEKTELESKQVEVSDVEQLKTKFLHLFYELMKDKKDQEVGYTAKANELIRMFDKHLPKQSNTK